MDLHPYQVKFAGLPSDLQELILDHASGTYVLSLTSGMVDTDARRYTLDGVRNAKRFVPCDVTIKLEQRVTQRGNRELALELRRNVNADFVNDPARGYSDADRSRLTLQFAYAHTWKKITKIAFVDRIMVKFTCGGKIEQAPPWFRFGNSSDIFQALQRLLTFSCGMQLTQDNDERVYEFSSTAPGESFDISWHDATYDDHKDMHIQFTRPDTQRTDSAGIDITVRRYESNFMWDDNSRRFVLDENHKEVLIESLRTWKNVTEVTFVQYPRKYILQITCGGEHKTVLWNVPHETLEECESQFIEFMERVGFVKGPAYSPANRNFIPAP